MQLATIGYEEGTVDSFLQALTEAGIDLLVDVRAAARSRKPGFAKSRLAAHLQSVGIEYLHLRGLGTPEEGRKAARAGDHETMKGIYAVHLRTPEAQADLAKLLELVQSGRQVCILCLEGNPEHCHRSLVAAAVAARIPACIVHLHPGR